MAEETSLITREASKHDPHYIERKLDHFPPALQAVAVIGEAASEGSHTLQVFDMWVSMYIYFRGLHPQLSPTGILSLVKQEWDQNKQSIIQQYISSSNNQLERSYSTKLLSYEGITK